LVYTLENVYFDTGKLTLKSSSYKTLDNLAELLTYKKDMVIEIAGHTDNVGDDAANQRLSEDRAKSVKSYLVSKGVSPEQIKAVGYGETVPIADNATEEGRSKNRRTEVKILNE